MRHKAENSILLIYRLLTLMAAVISPILDAKKANGAAGGCPIRLAPVIKIILKSDIESAKTSLDDARAVIT